MIADIGIIGWGHGQTVDLATAKLNELFGQAGIEQAAHTRGHMQAATLITSKPGDTFPTLETASVITP